MLLLKHRLLQLIVCLLITEKVSVESYNGIFVVTSCRKSKVSFVHYAPSVGVVESQAAINGDHVCCRINVSNVQFLHLPDECNQNDISSSNIGLRVKGNVLYTYTSLSDELVDNYLKRHIIGDVFFISRETV